MPIYAYRCEHCGHAKDVLQKVSDPVLTVCPACGEATFRKQVTAAGFQLKGSGWYVTDFKGDKKPAGKSADAEADSATKAGDVPGADAKTADSAPAAESGKTNGSGDAGKAAKADAPAAPAASPAPAPSPSTGSGGPTGGRQP